MLTGEVRLVKANRADRSSLNGFDCPNRGVLMQNNWVRTEVKEANGDTLGGRCNQGASNTQRQAFCTNLF